MLYLIFILPILASLLLLLASLRRLGRAVGNVRPAMLAVGLFTIFVSLADWLLVALLPVLHLSYGTTAPPAFMLNAARFVLLLVTLPTLSLVRPAGGRKAAAILACLLQGALLAIAFHGMYIEPFRLGVTRLELPQAPSFLPDRPLRILQLTDIHVEHPTRREGDMLSKTAALQPDLIVLTGDYLNPSYADNPQVIAETRQVLAQLHAPYGVYAVNGTVETPARMSALFDGLANIRVLDDETQRVPLPGGTLTLVGVTNTLARERDLGALETLTSGLPPDAYTLLLYHTPDLVEAASTSGVDLVLAGHTHGGQIRLPFYGAVITFSAYGKKYEMGEYRVGPTTLYVSRGIGLEGGWVTPRVRFLCPPEMVLVELGK